MKFVDKIFERATIRGIADYLLFGIGPDEDGRSYEERLEEPYERFVKAVAKYDKKPDSELLDLSNEITSETASVYTEIGLQAGFLLMKDMIKNLGSGERQEMTKSHMEDMHVDWANEMFLERMYKDRVEGVLQEVFCKDQQYQEVYEETEKVLQKIKEVDRNREEQEIFDRIFSVMNERSMEYGRIAYRQGFLDAVDLLRKSNDER